MAKGNFSLFRNIGFEYSACSLPGLLYECMWISETRFVEKDWFELLVHRSLVRSNNHETFCIKCFSESRSIDRSIFTLLSFFSIHVLIYAIQFHLKNIPSSKWRGRFERSRVYRRDKGTKGRRNKGSRVKKWSTGRWNLSSRFKESLWNHDNRDSVLI